MLCYGASSANKRHEGNMRSIIIDDEEPARSRLARLLTAHPAIEVVGEARDGIEAVRQIEELAPDLVFLDVQMPGLDGFGVIKKLADRKMRVPHIVFATAYDHYAVQAFDVNAVDYVLKPFDKSRLAKAISRAKRMMEATTSSADKLESLVSQLGLAKTQPVKLLVKAQQRMMLVDAEDVVFASIEDGLITVVARDVEGTSNYRTIEELQASLDSEKFWRAHRSYLVNINRIKEVVPWFKSSYQIRMDDKKQAEIPVSRAQTKRLRELLKL